MNCQEVWREISNYLDEDVDPALREALEEHINYCSPCTAVLDGTRNVIVLIGDDRAFDLPTGFADRLFERVRQEIA